MIKVLSSRMDDASVFDRFLSLAKRELQADDVQLLEHGASPPRSIPAPVRAETAASRASRPMRPLGSVRSSMRVRR